VIKHVVFYKLEESADGSERAQEVDRLRVEVEALRDEIPFVLEIELGENENDTEAAWDLALYSEFDSWEDLEAYQVHPAHERVKEMVDGLIVDRAVADYEI
jgi:hypothetical protein